MSTPRGVELNQNILRGIHDNRVPGQSNNDFDGLIISFRNGFGFSVGSNASIQNSINKGNKLLLGRRLAWGEVFFGALLIAKVNNAESSETFGQTEEFQNHSSEFSRIVGFGHNNFWG